MTYGEWCNSDAAHTVRITSNTTDEWHRRIWDEAQSDQRNMDALIADDEAEETLSDVKQVMANRIAERIRAQGANK